MSRKRAVLLLVLIIAGIFVSDQIAKFGMTSAVRSLYDPTTVLWTVNSGLSNDFNTAGNNAVFGTTAFNNCSGCKDIALTSSSTISTEALTNSSINTLGQAAAKNLLLSFNFYLNGNPTVNVPFYYFLTLNKTISSNQLTYNPLNDPNVVFALQFSCVSSCSSGTRIYSVVTYLQLKPGDSINSEIPSGVCTSSNSCFQSQQLNNGVGTIDPLSHIVLLQQYLNYTGGTTQNNPCPAVAGGFGGGCSTQWVTDDQTGFFYAIGRLLQPPLLSQPNYYFGIFTSPNFGSQLVTLYDVGTYATGAGQQLDPAASGFPAGFCPCNVRSMESDIVLLVSAAATPPAPTLDTSGFFGPIIKALIGVGVWILNGVMQFLGFLALAIRVGLNALGNFFGWGNIGDSFISAANGVAQTIGAVGNAITTFLSGIVLRGLDLINIVITFSSVFFTGLQKFLSEMSTVTGGIVTIFSKLFLYGGAFYFLYDLILYFQLTGDAGFEGVGTWIGFNKWAAFSVFGLITRILNALIGAFDWVLSHIPTISARMPEGGFPGVPQLAAGEFPGLRVPTGHVAKLREGDPAAFFLWAVGGFLILPFYLGSAISPLAGLVAAVGCNPTTCFNNMLTTVGYPFAGLFIIIFVGVTITEILHGVTDVGGQRIVIQNKLPAGFRRFKKEAKGEFSFGTGRFAQFKKGRAKGAKSKAVERQETISREQAYENRHGSSVFE